eukprot:6205529-Pleurochrysis_carterae.AAC.1
MRCRAKRGCVCELSHQHQHARARSCSCARACVRATSRGLASAMLRSFDSAARQRIAVARALPTEVERMREHGGRGARASTSAVLKCRCCDTRVWFPLGRVTQNSAGHAREGSLVDVCARETGGVAVAHA